MIKLLIPMGGFDKQGEPFNLAAGETVSLPDEAEKNCIKEGYAEAVRVVKKAAKKK
ncbi:MAG: hypothetical protein QNJ78_06380 [Gammaproteobacteria bacterium]|nr:hypothetical protein [Gammaproteobacteria bacterium]